MIAARLNTAADAAAARYNLFLTGLQGAYQRSFFTTDLTVPANAHRLVVQGGNMAQAYLAGEGADIADETQSVAANAHQTTLSALGLATSDELSGALSDHLDAAQTYLARELAMQTQRDVAFAGKSLRNAGLQIITAATSRGVSYRTAEIQHRANSDGELYFHVRNRIGYRLSSPQFVRASWRHHLLATHNETVMETLAHQGRSEATIQHPDPEHKFAGMRISLIPGSSLPSYDEVKDEAFHPNAHASLGP